MAKLSIFCCFLDLSDEDELPLFDRLVDGKKHQCHKALVDLAREQDSPDGGDQGLLNLFFQDWKKISFRYNMPSEAPKLYKPAYEL